ncbi:unnamed protein product, partial [marine sediment metagenome]
KVVLISIHIKNTQYKKKIGIWSFLIRDSLGDF